MSDKPMGKSVGEVTVTVKADVQDALKGIKALNRELRETTQILKQLEELQKLNELTNIQSIGILDIKNSDALVLKVNSIITDEQHKKFEEMFQVWLDTWGLKAKILVLDESIDIEVVRANA